MEPLDTSNNNDLVGKKESLFPELTTLPPMPAPVAKTPEQEPAPKPEIDTSLLTDRFQLSSRFDSTESTVPAKPQTQAAPILKVLEPSSEPLQVQIPEHAASRIHPKKKLALVGGLIVAILLVAGGSYVYFRPKAEPVAKAIPAKTQTIPVALPIYMPKNLPAGYKYNDDQKTVSTDVYSMSVTGPKKEYFYITQQNPPVNFDFTPFNKQLTDPRTYTADIGTVTTGSTKNSFIVSIRTKKDTWVIINSPNTGAKSVIEPVINALAL